MSEETDAPRPSTPPGRAAPRRPPDPESVPFAAAGEPLGHSAPLTHRADFPLLGLPLQLESNSPAVVAAGERLMGCWRALPQERVAARPPLRLRIIVHPCPQPEEEGAFVFRSHGRHILAARGANLLMVDTREGLALGFVTPQMVARQTFFAAEVLETLAHAVSFRFDRTPIHAGVVVRRGRPLMLAGRSGSGKSTLCYACLHAGFRLLTDDTVFVSLEGGPLLWASPRHLRLSPDTARFFPELRERIARPLFNGRRKIPVEASTGNQEPLLHAERPVVFLLQRRPRGPSTLTPASPQAVVAALAADPEPGFDLASSIGEAARVLAEGEIYTLAMGPDPMEAAERLQAFSDR